MSGYTWGSEATLTVTNLHSLGDGNFWQSAAQTIGSNEISHLIQCTLRTNTSAGSATGYCNVYIAASVDDGTTYEAAAGGSEGSYAPSTPSAAEQIKSAHKLGSVPMKADETTARAYTRMFAVEAALGVIPERYSIIIENKTGQALDSANNVVKIGKATG